MGEAYPQIERLRQLRKTLSRLRLNSIVLGADGRNRALLGQFVASTGRNAHQAGKLIFGPSRWLRGLIKPTHGSAPKYAGLNKVNPMAMMLSGVMMLRYLKETDAADRMENAIAELIREGKDVTYDMKPNRDDPTAVGTSGVADALVKKLAG